MLFMLLRVLAGPGNPAGYKIFKINFLDIFRLLIRVIWGPGYIPAPFIMI